MAHNILDDLSVVNYQSPAWVRLQEAIEGVDPLWIGQGQQGWTWSMVFKIGRGLFLVFWFVMLFTPDLVVPLLQGEPQEWGASSSSFELAVMGALVAGIVGYTVYVVRKELRQQKDCYYAIGKAQVWYALSKQVFVFQIKDAERVELVSGRGKVGAINFSYEKAVEPVPPFVDHNSEHSSWTLSLSGIDGAYELYQRILPLHRIQKTDVDLAQ